MLCTILRRWAGCSSGTKRIDCRCGEIERALSHFFLHARFPPAGCSWVVQGSVSYNVARALKYAHRLLIGVGLGVSGILDPAQMKAIFHDFIALICRLSMLSRLVSWKLKINPQRVAATLGCTSHVCLAGSWSFRRHK